MKQKIVNIILKITIWLVILSGLILLIGYYLIKYPPKYDIHFDITTQKIVSSRPLWILYVSNSSNPKGGVKIIKWKGKSQPPYEIDINNVDSGYYFNNNKIEKLNLEPNSKFILEPSGHGPITTIGIWTDSIGHVYKTIIESPIPLNSR